MRTRHDRRANTVRTDLLRIALISVAAGLLRFRMWDALGHPALFGLAAALVGAYPIFKDAVENLITRRMTMAPMGSIALVAALVARDVFTALAITGCVLGAGVLEALALSRGGAPFADDRILPLR